MSKRTKTRQMRRTQRGGEGSRLRADNIAARDAAEAARAVDREQQLRSWTDEPLADGPRSVRAMLLAKGIIVPDPNHPGGYAVTPHGRDLAAMVVAGVQSGTDSTGDEVADELIRREGLGAVDNMLAAATRAVGPAEPVAHSDPRYSLLPPGFGRPATEGHAAVDALREENDRAFGDWLNTPGVLLAEGGPMAEKEMQLDALKLLVAARGLAGLDRGPDALARAGLAEYRDGLIGVTVEGAELALETARAIIAGDVRRPVSLDKGRWADVQDAARRFAARVTSDRDDAPWLLPPLVPDDDLDRLPPEDRLALYGVRLLAVHHRRLGRDVSMDALLAAGLLVAKGGSTELVGLTEAGWAAATRLASEIRSGAFIRPPTLRADLWQGLLAAVEAVLPGGVPLHPGAPVVPTTIDAEDEFLLLDAANLVLRGEYARLKVPLPEGVDPTPPHLADEQLARAVVVARRVLSGELTSPDAERRQLELEARDVVRLIDLRGAMRPDTRAEFLDRAAVEHVPQRLQRPVLSSEGWLIPAPEALPDGRRPVYEILPDGSRGKLLGYLVDGEGDRAELRVEPGVSREDLLAARAHASRQLAARERHSARLREAADELRRRLDRIEAAPLLPVPADIVPRQYSPAVDAQRDALRAWDTPQAYALLEPLVERFPEDYRSVEETANLYRRMTAAGEPMWVGPQVCDVLLSAAKQWPDDARIPLEHMPAARLWVYFAKPMPVGVGQTSGKLRRLAALSLYRMDAEVRNGLVPLGSYAVVYYGRFDETPLPFPFAFSKLPVGATIEHLLHDDDGLHDDGHFDRGIASPDDGGGKRPLTLHADRILAALLAFCGQKLLSQSRGPVSREVRHRLERDGVEPPACRVITLRKRQHAPPSGEHRDVEWTCRWWVGAQDGGHWRTYHAGTPDERRVWIFPYIKGPDDKELKPPAARVFAAAR
jgi:hypothetical protein